MWDVRGLPLRYALFLAVLALALAGMRQVDWFRVVEDATAPDAPAQITRADAVERASWRLRSFLDRHQEPGRDTAAITVAHGEPAHGPVQGLCRDCEHWLVELVLRRDGVADERYCVAVTRRYDAFSSGCARWAPPAEPPPAALVEAARVSVAPPAGAGTLRFQRRQGRTADLHALDVGTGAMHRLTTTPEHEFSPAMSPDGRRIAFARNVGGSEYDVYVMNADGNGVRRLTDSPGPDEQPSWLPDGRLAFRSVRDGIGSIYVLDPAAPERGAERLLEETSSADWAPSGKAIVFAAAHPFGFDVWLTDPEGKHRWNLTSTFHEDAYSPEWSPDGTRLAFVTEQGIYVMRTDGTGLRRVVSAPHELALAWSPSGESLAWPGRLENGGIHVTRLADGATRRLTRGEWDLAPDWYG